MRLVSDLSLVAVSVLSSFVFNQWLGDSKGNRPVKIYATDPQRFSSIVSYLRMSALRIVCLPPLANVLAQRTRQMNAFVAEKGD